MITLGIIEEEPKIPIQAQVSPVKRWTIITAVIVGGFLALGFIARNRK